ncbi:MAG TPA: hypothetical protein VF186_02570 [Gaiellaceae bacterium]
MTAAEVYLAWKQAQRPDLILTIRAERTEPQPVEDRGTAGDQDDGNAEDAGDER